MSEQIYEDPNKLIFIQSRTGTNTDLVNEYAEMMRDGVQFDAVQGVRDGDGQIFIYDGLHRGAAARQVGALLLVEVRPGTKQDAEWLALAANQKHGLRRTREDIHRVIRQALLHPFGANLSNREIARHCGVNDKTVGKIRADMEASAEITQIDQRLVTRAGQTYTQDTTNIGRQPRPQAGDEPPEMHSFASDSPLAGAYLGDPGRTLPSPFIHDNHHEPHAQEFECPRCGQEKIVGVNGSRRWCLNCGAEWPTDAAFLKAVNGHETLTARPKRTSLQERFSSLVARLNDEQLAELEARLDELEHELAAKYAVYGE